MSHHGNSLILSPVMANNTIMQTVSFISIYAVWEINSSIIQHLHLAQLICSNNHLRELVDSCRYWKQLQLLYQLSCNFFRGKPSELYLVFTYIFFVIVIWVIICWNNKICTFFVWLFAYLDIFLYLLCHQKSNINDLWYQFLIP